MTKSKKVLITGISGFIGQSLAEYFSKEPIKILGLSRKKISSSFYKSQTTTYQSKNLAKIIDQFKPDVIIHAAGSASVGESFESPRQDFESSVLLLNSLLEGVRLSEYQPLVVFLSSAAVYGNVKKLPISEQEILKPISPYGYHKMMSEILLKEYSTVFNIPVLIARLFSVFGPKQKRLLLWELYEQFQNKNKKSVILEGTGKESRDYLYIEDLAGLLLKAIVKNQKGFNILNFASGKSHSIKKVAYSMKKILQSQKKVVFKGKIRAGDPNKWRADISLLEDRLNEKIMTRFEQRLKQCLIEWQKLKF